MTKKRIAPGLIIVLILLMITGCHKTGWPPKATISITSPATEFGQEVEITDAYCLDTQSGTFPFRFTLNNLQNQDIAVNYQWSLNDPRSQGVSSHINNTAGLMYQGQGMITLPASGQQYCEMQIKEIREYDPTFYVMYVGVYQGERQLAFYSGQKSATYYDYSVLPPTLKTE